MSEGVGPVPSPGQWARVQLAQGQSGAGLWDLSSDVPEARITIGSSDEAGWTVEAQDVAPNHFELFWDGQSLWVSPPTMGELTVDGERVTTWRQLVGRSRVEFGRAAFLIETSQTIAMPPAGQDTSMEAIPDRGETMPGAPAVPRVPAASSFTDDDPTAALMQVPDFESLPPLDSDATQMVDGALVVGEGFGRPMIGGTPNQFGGELKTQILDTEAAGIDLRPSSVPPAAPPSPLMTGPGAPLGQRQIPTDVLPASPAASVSETGSQFALPPQVPQDDKKKFELPPRRTLILAGVTLLLAVIVLGSSVVRRSSQAEAIEQANARNASQNASVVAEQIREAAVAEAAEQAEARTRRETALRDEVEAAIDEAVAKAEEEAAEAVEAATEEEPLDLDDEKAKRSAWAVQKLAIDVLARNDHRHALGYYLWLEEEYEDNDEYSEMVRVLRSILRRGESR
ncbi:MAG: hypothetical protein JJ863_07650 [Deltaproteobacteria bacterium]|nr:hypothetical protein [Deltaproteobacteria bacterium]